ncbi:MAG: hypothetical protein A2287_08600 [Candidatus Melainabacteria bacterium RIFOXYA12_FULL_32_12]|nr:MAG: hypothetical protein A2255_01305 [Candidatus Melainabacteria bacterium RIFOXYA2_FULL_32_9]OGI30440.1 MAG: hypothetical protein A2287_08600 [Candidatus Melainabacteria bacterium RIFOXYA12_FULL_32_12]
MKSLFFIIVALCVCFINFPKAISGDFLPRYSDSVSYYGIGVYFAPKEFAIYSEPDEESPIIEKINWNNFGVNSLTKELSSRNVFISFIPSKNIGIMSAIDDTENWCQVVYDQKTGAKGWVKITDSARFMTWMEFMSKYGKANDVYLFLDLPEEYRQIYTAPHEKAQILNMYPYSPDNVKLKFIKGNWMLVKVVDFSKTNTHIGWIRWRNDEGKIFAFPNLKQ